MSHLLPPQGHPARELFEVQDLVDVTLGARPVPWQLHSMRRQAVDFLAATPAASRVSYIRVNPSTDNLELISFGRRGGHRREWTFGPVGRRARLA